MILSIDLGSTNFKGALFDEELNRICESSVPSSYIRNDGTLVEMDANMVRREIIELIKQVCADANVQTNAIDAIALDSQAQNFAVFDMSGNPRTPILSWLDTRSEKEAKELWEKLEKDWHSHFSFPTLNGSMQLAQLLWVRHNMPEAFAGEYKIITLPGIVFNMFANINLTDDNLAAMSGTYSLRHKNWHIEALQYCGINPNSMPQCVPVGTGVKVHANCQELDFKKEIMLVPAGNDQTAGAVGNGCSANDIIVTLGTALVAYRRTGEQPGPYNKNGCWGPYPAGGYYELAFTSSGCLSLDWGREVLMLGENIKTFDEAAARAISGITEQTGKFYPALIRTEKAWQGEFSNSDEKAYAILEGIAFDLYNLVFKDLAATKDSTIKVIGGGSHSAVWMQIIADVLNCPVSVGRGDSLLGGAVMATGKALKATDSGIEYMPNKKRVKLLAARRLSYNHDVGITN